MVGVKLALKPTVEYSAHAFHRCHGGIDGAGRGRYNRVGVIRRRGASLRMAPKRDPLGGDMLEELRGRNLAHVGCTIGLTLGLFLGLVVALAIVVLVRTTSATNLATVAWFGLTFALGVVGYWAGGKFSRRLWGNEVKRESGD